MRASRVLDSSHITLGGRMKRASYREVSIGLLFVASSLVIGFAGCGSSGQMTTTTSSQFGGSPPDASTTDLTQRARYSPAL